jgi:glutathione S-transferase
MVRAVLRIYHREYAGRPIRAVWTLEELGEPYELVVMDWEEGNNDDHRARHPLVHVPVLEEDDGCVFESAAICLHLADLFPDAGLSAPLPSHERALIYQWSIFAPAELEPWLIEAAVHKDADAERAAKGRERFWKNADALTGALRDSEFLVGGRFTVADVLVGTALNNTRRAGFVDEMPSHLSDYTARLTARPAYQRAFERTAVATPS